MPLLLGHDGGISLLPGTNEEEMSDTIYFFGKAAIYAWNPFLDKPARISWPCQEATAEPEPWRECAACLDYMLGRTKEPCKIHGAKK